MSHKTSYDIIVIGGGAAGIIAAITAAKADKRVLLLEKLGDIAAKLKATGGGRCNLTNTLSNEEFMLRFGKNGRFMQDALNAFDNEALREFMHSIGVATHAPDGFRVFPTTHSSQTIIKALKQELQRVGVTLVCKEQAKHILHNSSAIEGVETQTRHYFAPALIIATGGLGYPVLGAEGDGYRLAQECGHTTTQLAPAMMPLRTKERWVANCTADTMPKVQLKVALKKHKKLHAQGDLIFTKNGIRGPVVLDFAREITPLLQKYGEVPLLLNLTKGKNEEQLREEFKNKSQNKTLLELLERLLPHALSLELCKLAELDPKSSYGKLHGAQKERLLKLLAWTPLHITGHDGFEKAMITRGGISLKEIDPKTMQSKKVKGLYFCGEVMDLDGPCGGYNLQWSFASGFLAGASASKSSE